MLQLNLEGIKDKSAWQERNVKLPEFDVQAMMAETKNNPVWVHFGAGNIFRGFIAALQQSLLNQELEKSGIIAADTFDYDIIDQIYRPHDNMTLMVSLLPDGTMKKEVIASIGAGLRAGTEFPEDMEQLKRTLKQGDVNGATGLELIDEKKLHELVPAVVGKFAMWSKNSGIMDPFLFTIGLAENAAENGAKFLFGHEILGIERVDDDYLRTGKGEYKAHWVINAAGLGCKTISDMLGITGYHVIGSKGNYIILDKRLGSLLPMPVYPVPSNTYMGIHVTPTVDGNVTVGPDAENVTDFSYYGVPQKNMEELAKSASNLWPHINKADQIRNFSGILPKWVDENGVIQDFKIEIKEDIAPHAVNLVGIESPGLTAAVPIAQYVVELMKEHERLVKNDQFIPEHKSIRRFATASFEEKNALIRENKEYGEIICSCEQVTKAEIRAAIRNPLGVATMTGVKYRTRAMMGTCQGGFCQMKIEQLIEEELGIPAKDVRYSRPDSWVLTGNMREEK